MRRRWTALNKTGRVPCERSDVPQKGGLNEGAQQKIIRLGIFAAGACRKRLRPDMPTQETSPSAPDALFFDLGPAWYYKASPSPKPREPVYRKATPGEEDAVSKAQAVLANTAGKALALVSGNEVV